MKATIYKVLNKNKSDEKIDVNKHHTIVDMFEWHVNEVMMEINKEQNWHASLLLYRLKIKDSE